MKLKVKAEAFKKALATVSGAAAGGTSTLPILNNVLLKAEGDKLMVACNNLELVITASFPAVVEDEGSITVPARIFTEQMKLIPDDTEISLQEIKGKLNAVAGRRRHNMKGISYLEFPRLPKGDDKQLVIAGKTLVNLLSQGMNGASRNDSFPVLMSVCLDVGLKDITAARTDGSKMVAATEPFKSMQEFKLLLPTDVVKALVKIIDQDIDVTISKSEKAFVIFEFGSISVAARLIDGVFPDYEQVMKNLLELSPNKLEVDRKALLHAVRTARVIATKDKAALFSLKLENNFLSFFSIAPELGDALAKIKLEKDPGFTADVRLSHKYLFDTVAAIKATTVTLQLGDGNSPVVVMSDNVTAIIMPLIAAPEEEEEAAE